MVTSVFLLSQQTENKIDEFPFVRYKRKQKTEVCSPWSTNDKRKSTIAISTNVPIYALHIHMYVAEQTPPEIQTVDTYSVRTNELYESLSDREEREVSCLQLFKIGSNKGVLQYIDYHFFRQLRTNTSDCLLVISCNCRVFVIRWHFGIFHKIPRDYELSSYAKSRNEDVDVNVITNFHVITAKFAGPVIVHIVHVHVYPRPPTSMPTSMTTLYVITSTISNFCVSLILRNFA